MRALVLSCLFLSGCSPPGASVEHQAAAPASVPHQADRTTELRLPLGARLEPSGFVTVEQAPPSPAEPPLKREEGNLTLYAELAGVTNEEAARRLEEQEAIRPEFDRLTQQLRTRERGNFTDAELIHRPEWAYLLYFKRDPEETLAKYTRNPRFQARHAPYTQMELQTLVQPWIDRFERERLFTGFGLNARQGRAEIDMVVSAEEYAAIAERNRWGPAPEYLQLNFEGAPIGPAVDASIEDGIRIFPQSDRNLGIIHQAAFHGRIVLRDGCFHVIDLSGKEQLTYFAREVGLGFDAEGYLALHSRTRERQHLGRIGENFTWAGPIPIAENAPMVAQLRERCGSAPLMHVGIPESSTIFNARYGLPRPPPPPPPPPPQPE